MLPFPADTTLLDLCVEAKAAALAVTTLSKSLAYSSAVTDLKNAEATDHKEHVVSFGKDSAGSIIRSAINTGNINSGTIPHIMNRFADIHIHTNEKPPSSGDLYGFISQALADTNYLRYILTPEGLVYAFALINKPAAIRFNMLYPQRPGIKTSNKDGLITTYQPVFPQQLVDEFNQIKGWGGATDEAAMAFILLKYKTGVALLKQDTDGKFKRLHTKETKDARGNKTYASENCP
ncbi:MAG: hypothetical protein QM594_20320 [Niabella sp.]